MLRSLQLIIRLEKGESQKNQKILLTLKPWNFFAPTSTKLSNSKPSTIKINIALK